MSDAPQTNAPGTTTAAACGRRTGPGRARGSGGQVVRAVEGRRHLRLRPHPPACRGLLDRHSPADRLRLAARRATSSPTPTPTWSRATSGCGARRCSTRWGGTTTGCRPSAGCRTTSASGATRRCPTTPTSRPPEKPDPKRQVPISRPNFVELCEQLVEQDEQVFEDLWRTLGLSVDWKQHYTTIGPKAQTVSQRAFLRNLARGEAYLQEAPTLWDVTFQTAVAQAELEAREYAGALPPRGLPQRRRTGPRRDHPSRADPLGRRPDRAPGRRALPAPVRHHGDLARLRRRDPRARPPRGRAGQGRRHRDVLHVR